MAVKNKGYPEGHWIFSENPEEGLKAYLEQQNKAYSKVKNHFIRELLGDLEGKSFLDYGCGAGMFSVHAAKHGASLVLGVDTERAVLSIAQHFASIERVAQRCNFLVSEVFPIFSDNTGFDVILLKDVAEHVEDDQSLFNSAANALKKDGIVLLCTQNAFSLNYLIEGGYNRLLKGKKDWYGWDNTHLRFYTPMSLKEKFRKAGLKITAWRSVYIIPHKIPLPSSRAKQFYRIDSLTLVDRVIGRFPIFNCLGWNIIVKAMVYNGNI